MDGHIGSAEIAKVFLKESIPSVLTQETEINQTTCNIAREIIILYNNTQFLPLLLQ